MTATREQIYSALFALVTPLRAPGAVEGPPDGSPGDNDISAAPGTPTPSQPFNLVSREVIEVQRVPQGLQPCLMQYEFNEGWIYSGRGLVKKVWTVIFIIGTTHTKGQSGAAILNPMIDALEAALSPKDGEDTQTLGGLVDNVQMVGQAGKDHGDNSTKTTVRNSAYYLPVEITMPGSC